MPENDERRETDADALARALELELKLKRATWEKTRSQRSTWRMLSILFVLLVFLGALLAYFLLLPELRSRAPERASSPAVNDTR